MPAKSEVKTISVDLKSSTQSERFRRYISHSSTYLDNLDKRKGKGGLLIQVKRYNYRQSLKKKKYISYFKQLPQNLELKIWVIKVVYISSHKTSIIQGFIFRKEISISLCLYHFYIMLEGMRICLPLATHLISTPHLFQVVIKVPSYSKILSHVILN